MAEYNFTAKGLNCNVPVVELARLLIVCTRQSLSHNICYHAMLDMSFLLSECA